MTDRPDQKRRLENLELNKETLQDLGESHAEDAQGGLGRPTGLVCVGGGPGQQTGLVCPGGGGPGQLTGLTCPG